MKLLTNREMELLRLAIYTRAAWEKSVTGEQPDVLSTAENLTKNLSFQIDPDDLAECCETVSGQMERG